MQIHVLLKLTGKRRMARGEMWDQHVPHESWAGPREEERKRDEMFLEARTASVAVLKVFVVVRKQC